jgi:hypothetical protein
MSDEPYDWADDDSMSAEETMRRFEALHPVPTTGPPVVRNFQLVFTGTPHVVRTAQTSGAFDDVAPHDPPPAFDPRPHRLLLTPTQ